MRGNSLLSLSSSSGIRMRGAGVEGRERAMSSVDRKTEDV